jgi:hypothetical protein
MNTCSFAKVTIGRPADVLRSMTTRRQDEVAERIEENLSHDSSYAKARDGQMTLRLKTPCREKRKIHV